MKKVMFAAGVAALALVACSKKDAAETVATADSTAVVDSTADSTAVVADSTAVVADSTATADSTAVAK